MAQSQQSARKISKSTITIPLRIQRESALELDRLAYRLHAKSRNEIIRDAIRQYTQQMVNTKIVEIREVSVARASKLIDEYISKHPGKHYVSELSEALGIDLSVAFEAAQRLLADGVARKRS